MRFRLRIRGEILEVDMRPGRVDYRLVRGKGLEICHGEKLIQVRPGKAVCVEMRNPE